MSQTWPCVFLGCSVEQNYITGTVSYFSTTYVCLSCGMVANCCLDIKGPLLKVPCFRQSMIRWCAMHVIHLGCDLWIAGSTLKFLLAKTDTWGSASDLHENERLYKAWTVFKEWCRRHKWQTLISVQHSVLYFPSLHFWLYGSGNTEPISNLQSHTVIKLKLGIQCRVGNQSLW